MRNDPDSSVTVDGDGIDRPSLLPYLVGRCVPTLPLLIMVLSAVWCIHQTQWVEGTGVLLPTALAGVGAGLVLARSRVGSRLALIVGLLAGAGLSVVVVGQLMPPPNDLARRLVETLTHSVAWLRSPSGPLPAARAITEFGDGAGEVFGRVRLWAQVGLAGGSSSDNTVFLLLIAYVAWVQGFVGAWGVYRLRDVLVAAFPTGIALAMNAASAGTTGAPFGLFIMSVLLLAVSLNMVALRERWERLSVDYPEGLLSYATATSLLIVVALGGLAFLAPRPVDPPLSHAFWSHFGDQWSEFEHLSGRLFAGINGQQSADAFGRATLALSKLSSGQRAADQVVMRARPISPDGTPNSLGVDHEHAPHSWRGIAYDTYTGRTWRNSDTVELPRTERHALAVPRSGRRTQTKFHIELSASRSDLLYVPAEPVRLSIPHWIQTQGSDVVQSDHSALRAKKPPIQGLGYTVEALAATSSAGELRDAPPDVPDWVKRYAQLPDVPLRVRDLSTALTQGRPSSYDQAVAVEQFLRQIPTAHEWPVVPPDRDAVDHLLFEARRGNAHYLASAMAVLLRVQGIPTRLATGYVAGQFDTKTQEFLVTEADAHAWPEVYFQGQGWIAFEPSGDRPLISRPEAGDEPTAGDSTPCDPLDALLGWGGPGECSDPLGLGAYYDRLPGDPVTVPTPIRAVRTAGRWPPIILILPGLLALMAVGGAGYSAATALGERRLSPQEMVRRTYRRMTAYGAFFGVRRAPAETPLEYAARLTRELGTCWQRESPMDVLYPRRLFHAPNGEAESIAAAFVRTRYGRQDVGSAERDHAVQCWKHLRWQLPVLLLRDRRSGIRSRE